VVPPTVVPPTVVPLPESASAAVVPPTGADGEFADFFSTGEITGPLGRSGHRAASQLGPLARRLAAPVGAVAVVVIVILLLIWINGKPAGKQTGPGVVAAPRITTSPTASSPVVPPSPGPTAATQPTSHPKPTKPKATKSAQVGAANPHAGTAMAPVVVLNNSMITGLAAQVASEVRAKGWHIKSVGNQRTVISESTLYFAPGEHAAAMHLAKQFPQIRRVRSAASAGITSYGANLTLVVTRDWT
jgi:hypothetical protein